MTHTPSLTAREVIRALRSAGFVFDRQAKGSHEIWYNPETCRRVTVPNHPGRPITRPGDARSYARAASPSRSSWHIGERPSARS